MSQPWHSRTPEDVLAEWRSSEQGLSATEAAEQLARFGPNVLRRIPAATVWEILVAQLRSVVVVLLAAAAAVSALMRDHVEALAILVVLIINTIVGFVTEWRARRAIEALGDLDVPQARVVREGRLQLVDAQTLVPGDIAEIQPGLNVPADGRLIDVTDLRVDESALTGESLPVSKQRTADLSDDTPLAERVTMAFKGTTSVAGFGRMVVVATGAGTEVGRIGALVEGVKSERTPLERQLDALGRRLVWVTLAIAGFIALLGLWQGLEAGLVLQTAIALAVAAVPEALPAVATIALAVGVHRMARRQALVRSLPAVESLGSTTVICTDKTKTLTSGIMTLVRTWIGGRSEPFPPQQREAASSPPGSPLRAVVEAAVLASRETGGEHDHADPVDVAMTAAGHAAGITAADLAKDRPFDSWIPFSSEQKWMAAFHWDGGKRTAFVKGAPRSVLERCDRFVSDAGVRPLDDPGRAAVLAGNEALARDGLRVLAVASGPVTEATEAALRGLTLLGLVGLADPPAPGVKETIARLRAAGLRTIMLTGDQRVTAEAIGRELGVLDEGAVAIDGRQLDGASDAEVRSLVADQSAFSRVTPEHKLIVVRALRAEGEVVAMFGDGINDAAALRQSDVGVAMGKRGTDVAKQAAAIVLQDDRFETIAAAVEEGRVIFDNIRKFVFYLFSCNVAEVLVLLVAGVAGWPLPLLPLHLLWLNLVTDTFPALALALEPAESNVMRRPPRRPDDAFWSRTFVLSVVGYAALITASTLAGFWWALGTAPEKATTMTFMTLGLAQTFHLGNARSHRAVLGLRRMFSNPFAILGTGLAVLLQVLALTVPALATVLGLSALSNRDLTVAVALAAVPAVIGQVIKVVRGSSLAGGE
jgi:Ca2+-transporting ATPase